MVACAPQAAPVIYRRRQPEKGTLYQAVAEHLPAFLAAAEQAERPVPKFVRREFEAFLTCGLVEKGCVRVRCPACGFDRLVAFSCKGRSGICSSCGARRMVETATHLCELVLPEVPIRQWVLSVPPPVRYALAYDAELLSRVIAIFVQAIFAHLRLVARRELGLGQEARIESGAICVPQRFNSALGLAPHLHALVVDGVWVSKPGDPAPVFHALPAPCKAEIAQVAWTACERTVALLRKRGQWIDADASDDRLCMDEPLLSTLASSSIAGVLALGPNAGQRPMRLFGAAARDENADQDSKPPKNAYGFDLHAGVRAAAKDKQQRERLCRYLLRPPLSNDRLSRLADGRYSVRLKKPWSDGTTHVVLSGAELLGRLAVLVPPPKVHTTRYFGCFAPRSALRRLVVPAPPKETDNLALGDSHGPCSDEGCSRRRRMSWASLLRKVFELEVKQCPRCHQQGMQQIAVLTQPATIRALLAAIARQCASP